MDVDECHNADDYSDYDYCHTVCPECYKWQCLEDYEEINE